VSYLGSSFSSSGPNAGFVGGVGFGYRVNDMVRLDATWDYWTGPDRTRSFAAICPYGPVGVTNALGPAGYLYDPTNTRAGSASFRQHNNTVLANAYVDLGTYYGFTPYVGAGAGLNANALQGSTNFIETANGLAYAANLTSNGAFPSVWVNSAGQPINPAPNVPLQNWNRSISSTTYHFAWAVMAGISFAIGPSATLDIGYRYLNAGPSNLLLNPQTGLSVRQSNVSQQILVSIRYVLN
jgi:opacity protein-like surface antigen